MGGLSPNLASDGDAPNIYRTDGRGNPLTTGHTDEKSHIPGRYDPDVNSMDPAFDSGMVTTLSLASIALVAGLATIIVTIPTVIVRRLRRRNSS